jgi:hypothetical protein
MTFSKGDRVEVSRGAEGYDPGNRKGEIVREREDGRFNVRLDRGGDIIKCAGTELTALDDAVWPRLERWLDEEAVVAAGTGGPNHLESAGRAMFGFDALGEDEDADWIDEWDDLTEPEQQEWVAMFAAGLDVMAQVLGRRIGESRKDIERVRRAVRNFASFTLTGEYPEGAENDAEEALAALRRKIAGLN